ncbi:MAG: hypothetical protein KAU31_16145, partial [Spirochaetaceae bacterium]|nr:hypothetical protein [Spirochaetaceae bacterium]
MRAEHIPIGPCRANGPAGEHWHDTAFDFYTIGGATALRDRLNGWDGGNLVKERFISNDLVCEKVIGRFQLIANKARFRIMCLLREDWFSVNEIVE